MRLSGESVESNSDTDAWDMAPFHGKGSLAVSGGTSTATYSCSTYGAVSVAFGYTVEDADTVRITAKTNGGHDVVITYARRP